MSTNLQTNYTVNMSQPAAASDNFTFHKFNNLRIIFSWTILPNIIYDEINFSQTTMLFTISTFGTYMIVTRIDTTGLSYPEYLFITCTAKNFIIIVFHHYIFIDTHYIIWIWMFCIQANACNINYVWQYYKCIKHQYHN